MTTSQPVPDSGWNKARASSGTGGCVEVAVLGDGRIAVRDSKDPSKAPHIHTRDTWREFTDLLRQRGTVSCSTDHVLVDVTAAGVTLHDVHQPASEPHTYTHHEWDCFLDGVRNLEPQLACA